jgi:hypothetical protein
VTGGNKKGKTDYGNSTEVDYDVFFPFVSYKPEHGTLVPRWIICPELQFYSSLIVEFSIVKGNVAGEMSTCRAL